MSTAISALPEHLPNGYQSANGSSSYSNANGQIQPMDGRQSEYPQSGLSSPHQQQSKGTASDRDDVHADQGSAAQYAPQGQDVKFSSTGTPTTEYGLNPSSARSGTFPEYIQRSQYPEGARGYQPSSGSGGAPGAMAHSTSPSMPQNDAHLHSHHPANNAHSDSEVPIDPSIAASSPTYPHSYSPYGQHEMHYQQPPPGMYRPEHAAYQGGYPHGLPPHYGHGMPTSVGPPQPMGSAGAGPRPPGGGHPLSTVYSFVPIPGTHQHKRPRRRYEEIERMYKCGWNGCEKAYGTLNHLNAHVTMQSHGSKRTPEEFKEIRKEWKARKKEEETARKAAEERDRQSAGQGGPVDGANASDSSAQQTPQGYPPSGVRQLPPLGYAPAGGQVQGQYGQPGAGMEGMPQYGAGQMYSGYPPQSPYGQGNNQMYQQRHSPDRGQPGTQG